MLTKIFLDELGLSGSNLSSIGLLSSFMMAFIGIFIVIILLLFLLYIYLSLAYSQLGRKAGLKSPEVAWMPFAGPLAIIFESSEMHWWPFPSFMCLISLGYILMLIGFGNSLVLKIASGLFSVSSIIFSVMIIIWHWKTYEAVGKPGWWILLPAIFSFVGFALAIIGAIFNTIILVLGLVILVFSPITHLVLIGMAAWSSKQE